MKLHINFTDLEKSVNKLGPSTATYNCHDIALDKSEKIAIKLSKGMALYDDIPLEDISYEAGVLEYEGCQVMLYIPEPEKKVHIAECRTLEEMRNKGRFQRYIVTNRIDGKFKITEPNGLTGNPQKKDVELAVCKNCLSALNYKGYTYQVKRKQDIICNEFHYGELFETYSSYFKSFPKNSHDCSNYTKEWSKISSRMKQEANYTCEYCNVNLTKHSNLLHTHHVNGVKSDNNQSNLRVLCLDCHKKQPNHTHMHVKHESILKINQYRKQQGKCDPFDYSKLEKFADTAMTGLISKCKSHRLPVPKLGEFIKISNIHIDIDLAWPERQIAVLINQDHSAYLKNIGWEVFHPHDAMHNFESFQVCVR